MCFLELFCGGKNYVVRKNYMTAPCVTTDCGRLDNLLIALKDRCYEQCIAAKRAHYF